MTTDRSTRVANLVDTRRAIVRRSRCVIPLALTMLAIFAASAQAHTATATTTCGSVTIDWSLFAATGNGNGGLNTPQWTITLQPTVGSTVVMHGTASFAGSTFSQTIAIPSSNGVAMMSTWWSAAQTRDDNSNSVSTTLTIAGCPTPVPSVTPPAPPPVVPSSAAHANVLGALALSTTASSSATLGGAIRDTAVLSRGSSPTGTITFSLYSASDTTCSTVLDAVTAVVNGDGSYVSPPVTPASSGSYQWVATYGGDVNNPSVSASCNNPAERSTFTYALCIGPLLRGVTQTATNSLSAYVPATPDIKDVTFYLDGRKLETETKPSHQRFSVVIDVRTLSLGVHRLRAEVTTRGSRCPAASVGETFIHTKSESLSPTFTG